MNIINDLKLQYRIGGMTTKLIFWNIILFVIPALVFGMLKLFKIDIDYHNYIALSNNYATLLVKPWTLISYSFFHIGFFHLLFNVLVLNFVGKLFTTFFTQKQLLSLYLLGGILGGILYIISYTFLPLLANENALLIGASGSIMAILVATATYQPEMEVRLLFLGSIKLVYLAIGLFLLDLINLSIENTGGHLAHIGGALFGFVYIKSIQNGTDLGSGLTSFLDWCVTLFSPRKAKPFKKVHRNPKTSISSKPQSKIVVKDKAQQQIDEILDKISKSGYDSLTTAEKEFLFQAGK
ncbi:rhomboid family intramembrane serine protease [Flavobacterium sp.]|uniref:rhomboid family intramembrane serine protease n=1 Tax=Flavobacterium sp. TaxID=239 RepID=UPI00286DC296|nr:rhomboid family intramembrane serine protease [Flavobacterium sp.]